MNVGESQVLDFLGIESLLTHTELSPHFLTRSQSLFTHYMYMYIASLISFGNSLIPEFLVILQTSAGCGEVISFCNRARSILISFPLLFFHETKARVCVCLD